MIENKATAISRLRILLVQAVEEEVFDWQPIDVKVRRLLTGIGKVNTASRLTEAIMQERPDVVLNVGTAGTLVHAVGDILVCDRFVDRDLQPLAIHGVTSEVHAANKHIWPFMSLRNGRLHNERFVVSTGDSFVTQPDGVKGDVVDMEAFAAAVVCQHFGLSFLSVKYVTDVVGENSIQHWEDKLAQARQGLRDYFADYHL